MSYTSVSQIFWVTEPFELVNTYGTDMFCGPSFIKQMSAQRDLLANNEFL
jgi:hypothetical protein